MYDDRCWWYYTPNPRAKDKNRRRRRRRGRDDKKSSTLVSRLSADCITTATLALLTAMGGSVAEWLACLTQAQKGPGSNRSRDAVG